MAAVQAVLLLGLTFYTLDESSGIWIYIEDVSTGEPEEYAQTLSGSMVTDGLFIF
jgi:hypothetical protein